MSSDGIALVDVNVDVGGGSLRQEFTGLMALFMIGLFVVVVGKIGYGW